MDRARRATTAAKSAASEALRSAKEAKSTARAQLRAATESITEELGGPRRSIAEAMAPYMREPARPGTERARYEAIMGKPYPGTEPTEDDTMGRGRRRKTRKSKKAGRRRRSTRRRA